jgi:hypothetical protein
MISQGINAGDVKKLQDADIKIIVSNKMLGSCPYWTIC